MASDSSDAPLRNQPASRHDLRWNPLALTGVVFDPLQLQMDLLDVATATHASAASLQRRQQDRIRRLLQDVRRTSAVYRERIGTQANVPLLSELRPVTRPELMQRFEEWVSDPRLKLDELQEFVRDRSRIGTPWLGRYMVCETSGTTGKPGIFVQDARALSVYDALEMARHQLPSGLATLWTGAGSAFDALGLGNRYALVVATGGHFASVASFERLRRINPWLAASARSFDLLQPLPDLVRALNAFKPSVLATYPTAAALLADEAEAGRLRIQPRSIVTGGETLGPAIRTRLESAFGAAVRNSYGASEFLPMAWECAHGGLHLNTDWLVLEPVDEHYRPVPPGVRSHTVLLTNLANRVQPIIRYDLSDRVIMKTEPCACGSCLPVIEVSGRSDDTFRVRSQRKGQWVSLLPMALCTVVEDECGLFDFQLSQQDASTLRLRVSLSGAAASAAVARCRAALQRFAHGQGAAPIKVVAETGCEVPRGRTGKACRIAWEAPA